MKGYAVFLGILISFSRGLGQDLPAGYPVDARQTVGLDIIQWPMIKEKLSLEKPIRKTLEAGESHAFGVDLLFDGTIFPDALLTLGVTNVDGDADLYCNPWSLVQTIGMPSPSFAAWSSDHSQGNDHVFLSRNAHLFVQEPKINVTIEGEDYVSARFVCAIVGQESLGSDVELEIDVDYESRMLNSVEMDAMGEIYKECCSGEIGCLSWPRPGSQDVLTEENSMEVDGKPVYLDFCHAYGSVCDGQGRLVRLDVRRIGLACDFPKKQITKLKKLEKLDMGSNALAGDIEEIGSALQKLEKLVHFGAESNFLSGNLTEDTSICGSVNQELFYLNLNGNQITGTVAKCLVDSDSKLQELHLDRNSLSGTLPEFSASSKLEIVSVGDNKNITGGIPESLGKLKRVRAIRLAGNSLVGEIPESIAASASLQILLLNENELTGKVPESVAESKALREIQLQSNRLTGMPKKWEMDVQGSESLTYLDVNTNNITGSFPLCLARAPNLTYLNIAYNQFGGVLPAREGLFPKTISLILSYNEFEGEIPQELGSTGLFAGSISMALFVPIFTLAHNRLSGPIPEFLFDRNRPEYLTSRVYLGGNQLSCPEPEQLHFIPDIVCFRKCESDFENVGLSVSALPNPEENGSNGKGGGLSVGAKAALGTVVTVVGALLVFLVIALIAVRIRKNRWQEKLDEVAGPGNDIEIGRQ